MNENNKEKDATKPTTKYSKEKLLSSAAYKDKCDLLSALLEDGKEYTKAEVDALVKGYQKREINPRFSARRQSRLLARQRNGLSTESRKRGAK